MINYPITLEFKILALSNQIYIRDNNQNVIGYSKQALLKLKEEIRIKKSKESEELLYNIDADRIIDFSANYSFTRPDGSKIGSVGRKGMRSLWSATYLMKDAAGDNDFTIKEANAWVKVIDGIVGGIPILGFFTGLMFNPKYNVIDNKTNEIIGQVVKEKSLLGKKFTINLYNEESDDIKERLMLSSLMLVTLERARG